MAREGEQQAMTSERLAALAERAEHCYRLYVDDDTRLDRDYPDLPHDYCCDVEELLAEVERRKARETALLAFAEMVESNAGVSSYLREQARALLASAGEGSGGDGA